MRSQRVLSGVLLATVLFCSCEDRVVDNPRRIPSPFHPTNPSELIAQLEDSYQRRDYRLFASLFPDDAEAPFLFFLCEPLPGGHWYWGRDEELRIHRRMFDPDNPLPGETPVPPELWLVAITITLTPLGDWTERTDLYRSPSDSTGLDPARWRATEAQYHADVLWDTQSNTAYRVNGRQNFVVIEDLLVPLGEERKFLLYRWEDLCSQAGLDANEKSTWSQIKGLYYK